MRRHLSILFLSALLLVGCAKEDVPAPTPPVVEAPVPEHLTLGNPSGATANGNQPNNPC